MSKFWGVKIEQFLDGEWRELIVVSCDEDTEKAAISSSAALTEALGKSGNGIMYMAVEEGEGIVLNVNNGPVMFKPVQV